MAFKKIHRRSDLLKKRADILGLGASTTSSSSTAGPHGVQEPTGPPLVLSSTHSTSAAAGATTTSSSVVSAPTSASSSVPTSVPTTPPAASSTPNGQVNTTPGNLVTRASSTVRVTVTNTSHSASASATTAESDSGMGIGSIAGIGVAAIVAIGVASAFVIWLIKRRNKNRDIDEEPFNRNSFMRHSAAIPDDDDSHLPGVAPRPPATPAMSERNPTPLYGQQNVQFGGSDFGYATQPSYGAPVGGMYSPNPFGPGGAPATPLPHSPGYGNTYDQGYGGQPGGYQELTRGGPHDYPPSPGLPMENPHSPGYGGSFPMPPQHGHEQDMMHNPHGDGVVRSMTPVGHGQVVSVPDGMHDGRATPVQMGFAPPPQHPQHPQQQGPGPNGGKARPETVYDTDDAYGGI